MDRAFLVIGSVLGFLGVAFGAFVSHALRARLSPDRRSELNRGWVRELDTDMRQFATGGLYVNFLGEEGHDRVREAYIERSYQRLVELKNGYDRRTSSA